MSAANRGLRSDFRLLMRPRVEKIDPVVPNEGSVDLSTLNNPVGCSGRRQDHDVDRESLGESRNKFDAAEAKPISESMQLVATVLEVASLFVLGTVLLDVREKNVQELLVAVVQSCLQQRCSQLVAGRNSRLHVRSESAQLIQQRLQQAGSVFSGFADL